MADERQYVDDAIFRVGRVVGVEGRTVRIRVDKAKNGSHLLYRGKVLRNVSVGGYLKITKGFTEIIVKVDGESVTDMGGDSQYRSRRDGIDRVLAVSLVGYFSGEGFTRGVKELPLVDNECYLLSDDEFDRVHNFIGDGDVALRIGRLAMEEGHSVRVGVNALFASHIGIFGNTGSGKSYTLAKLYHELLMMYRDSEAFKSKARIVLIDFNGEYINAPHDGFVTSTSVIADDELKSSYALSTRDDTGAKLPVSKDMFEDPVFWTVLLDATEKTQAPFLQRVLQSEYWERKLSDPERLGESIGGIVYAALKGGEASADKGLIVKFLEELHNCIDPSAQGQLSAYVDLLQANLSYHSMSKVFFFRDSGVRRWGNEASDDEFFRELTYGRFSAMPLTPEHLGSVDRVRFKIVLQYYSDIFNGYANREHLGPLIKRLETRIPRIRRLLEVSEEGLLSRPLTVVGLKNVSLDMKKVIPLLVCRQLYEEHKARPGSGGYLNLVVDEAHNILSESSARESEAWKDYRLETFEEIIKEGRKFGVFLTIASQRPHDISQTIISQLHNYFLHRLVNNLDVHAIEKAVSFLDRVSFESLPILPTGTCVLSGISAQVPLLVTIDKIEDRYEPNSKTMTLADGWVGLPSSEQ